MRNVEVERTVAAPRSSVWAVSADHPDIADWNDGEPEGGPSAAVLGPMLDRRVHQGFDGFVDSLATAARARASA